MFILITALLHFAPPGSQPAPADCTASTRIVANPDGTTTIITRTVCVREGK